MVAVLLGLFAALCWSLHDLAARHFAAGIGPYRMAICTMLAGAALCTVIVAGNGFLADATVESVGFALAMGLVYTVAIGGLFKAFSLAPISVVGPFTAAYPALVVAWGLLNGLSPAWVEWLAFILVLGGAMVVARTGHEEGGINAIAPGKYGTVIMACVLACFGFAAAVVLGQKAAVIMGEFETTFLSRFPAAIGLLPFAWRERSGVAKISRAGWLGIGLMALLDVLAVSGINYAGHFPNRSLASMGISAYGGLSVLLAMIVLKERVSLGQWSGIAMIVAGVGILGWPR